MVKSRRKTEEVANDPNDVFGEQIADRQAAEIVQPTAEPPVAAHIANPSSTVRQPIDAHAGNGSQKKEWAKEFGHCRFNQTGARIQEDRKNHLSTIIFRHDVPQKALAAAIKLLEDHGFERDEEAGGWSRKVSKLRPTESRETADELLHQCDNIIRAEMGLEPSKSYYISRS
jgi:hypothetical protein